MIIGIILLPYIAFVMWHIVATNEEIKALESNLLEKEEYEKQGKNCKEHNVSV